MKQVIKEILSAVGNVLKPMFIVEPDGLPTETGSWEAPPIFYLILIAILIIIHETVKP